MEHGAGIEWSSAGPGSATAAGCVAFSIGWGLGSISAPSTRCGATGLGPTFGLVPRTGAMALSWTMDKLGPICRAVEDCAIVLDAIAGPNGHDRAARGGPFNWDAQLNWKTLRVGYLKSDFERGPQAPTPLMPTATGGSDSTLTPDERRHQDEVRRQQEANRTHAEYDRRFDHAALEKLAAMGVSLTPVELPDLPWQSISPLLQAEAAAAFDDLTRSGRDKLLTGQAPNDWPDVFRAARFMPAVEYIQANRARMIGMEAMAKAFNAVDVVVAPTSSCSW